MKIAIKIKTTIAQVGGEATLPPLLLGTVRGGKEVDVVVSAAMSERSDVEAAADESRSVSRTMRERITT